MHNNSPDRSTKSTSSHINVLWVLVSAEFQVLFTPILWVLFTFPSRYYSTIGHQVVFRLRGWSPCLPTAISRVPRYSGYMPIIEIFRIRDSHSLWSAFPYCSSKSLWLYACPKPVQYCYWRLAFFAFAHHYSQNHCCFLFLRLLRWFSSAGSLNRPMYSVYRDWALPQSGFPIRKSTDQRLFASPRGLSQLVTSFIGSWCQGILSTLFFTWPFCLRFLY